MRLCFVVLSATVAIQPALSPGQQAEPLQLQPVFDDDFSADTRSNYTVRGDVSWEQGQLTLPEQASIERGLEGGPWTAVRLRLQPLRLTDQQTESELRIWFILKQATNCYVRLVRRQRGQQVVSSVALIDTGEEDGKPVQQVVREVTVDAGELRDIHIEYRHGLVRVRLSDDVSFLAGIRNGDAPVAALAIHSTTGNSGLDQLAAATHLPEQKQYSDAEKQQLAKANEEALEIVSLYRQSRFADAAQIGERVLAVRRAVLGERHPDYLRTLNNLVAVYNRKGDYPRAQPLQRQATEIRKLVLGEQHLDYAKSLRELAHLHMRLGDHQPVVQLLTESMAIHKAVLGERHSIYASELNNLGFAYQAMGDLERAKTLYQQAIEIQKSAAGTKPRAYAGSLNNLATLYIEIGRYAQAEPLLREATEILKSELGERHPDYATTLNSLGWAYRCLGDYDRAAPLQERAVEIRKSVLGERHPGYAVSLNTLGRLYKDMRDYTRAEQLYREAMKINKEVLGEQHPAYVTGLANLAVLYSDMGEYAKAERLHKRTLEIKEALFGKEHPDYGIELNNLARLYEEMGEYSRAERFYHEASDVLESVHGGRHPNYANCLRGLADLYQQMGDYVRAEPLERQAMEITKELSGERHPDYALSLTGVALLHLRMGDYARAEPLFVQALEITKSAFGEQHGSYASSLGNLASLHAMMGNYARAEPLYRQASEIFKTVAGEDHLDFGTSLNNLASVHSSLGNYSQAETLLKKAAKILGSTHGGEHPNHSSSLGNLAGVYREQGDYARAEQLYKQALEIDRSVYGERHPDYAVDLMHIANLYRETGDDLRAEPLYRQALTVQRNHINATAAVQSARQQSRNQQALRRYLDGRLTNALAIGSRNATTSAEDLWQWKGSVTARQQAYRRISTDPKLVPLFEELQAITRQLSAASSKTPTPPDSSAPEAARTAFEKRRKVWEQRVLKLTLDRERLEQQIASGSAEFRRVQEPLTVAMVGSLLPEETAFIDFLEYKHSSASTQSSGKTVSERRYLAVVVTDKEAVRLVGLGAADPINAAITEFRRPLTGRSGTENQGVNPARKLRELVWLPLEEHLDGITTIIISPDMSLGTLPFAALPGETSGSYLIERYRFTTLPLAGMLRSLLDRDDRVQRQDGLLVLGDVNYDAKAQAANPRPMRDGQRTSTRRSAPRGEGGRWNSLPGFQEELAIVRNQFKSGLQGGVTTLQKANATEAEFLTQAAKHRVLHLITHGYFADPGFEALGTGLTADDPVPSTSNGRVPEGSRMISQYMPGLLSGLVLAGANNPPPADNPTSDGILTASEIETLNLNGVDLVVLSACETGLGQTAGGEGLTGLQRAFHIAGARSCVATLWEVDDRATQELVRRFYTNLWEHEMSKIDALREAQLWMLRHPQELQAMGVKGAATRGKQIKRQKPVLDAPRVAIDRTDPYFWAAFQLSGDWR